MKNCIDFDNGNKVHLIGVDEFCLNKEKFFETYPNLFLEFKGNNNLLILDKESKFLNTKIVFESSYGLCFLNKTTNNYINLNLFVHNNSSFYLGSNCSFNGRLNVIASENRVVFIGNDTMFSFGIWIRTSDVHPILDIETRKILNKGKDVIIGNHVWVGQSSTLLKGAIIGSFSVIGLGTVMSKIANSNSIWGGNPARKIKENVIWDRPSMHSFSTNSYEKIVNKFSKDKLDGYIPDDNSRGLDFFKNGLEKSRNTLPEERAKCYINLKKYSLVINNKKRFFNFLNC